MSKQKKNSRRHSRIRFPFPALNIGNIIFGALFFYMAVSLFFYLTADHIKSFQVVQGTLSRNDTYTAFAMRTESVQLSSGSGYVQFYTPNASKISRGSAVYGISATENSRYLWYFGQMRQRERRFVPRSHVFLLIMIPSSLSGHLFS